MARGTEEQEQAPEVSADFPYRALMSHPAWATIDNALGELENNDDLQLRTARRYVIGFLIQQMVEQGNLPPAIVSRPDTPGRAQPRYRWTCEIEVPEPSRRSSGRRRRKRAAPVK